LEQAMLRRLACAGAIILLITAAAGAQSNTEVQSSPFSVPFKEKEAPPSQEQIERRKAADKAYEAAIRKLPDKKPPADPWGDVRPAKGKQ
jgi:hypothetical protein